MLSGVWPGFKELSREGMLLSLAPGWFKRLYLPRKEGRVEELIDLEPRSLRLVSPESNRSLDPHSHVSVDSHILQRLRRIGKPKHDITPLVLWLLESRVRLGMKEGLPVIRRQIIKSFVPAIILGLLWRRVPSSRNPLRVVLAMLLLTYIISLSRGLPPSAEKLFRFMHFSAYRKKGVRPFITDQSSGSLKALLYAIVEPFLPVVNEAIVLKRKPEAVPNSPTFSQASTLDQSVML